MEKTKREEEHSVKKQPPLKKSKGDEEAAAAHETHHNGEEMKRPEYIVHAIQHIEIPCKDLDRITKFYHDVFGWKITATPFPFYSIWTPPGNAPCNGGFFKSEGDIPAKGIGLNINVEDIDAALEKIKQHGGIVVKEKFLISEEIGHNAFFKDTEGNELALYSQPESMKHSSK